MKVLFLPSWYPASAADICGSFFREQALALHRSGCRVGVIAPTMGSLQKPISALRNSTAINVEDDQGMPTYRKTAVNWTPRLWQANAKRFARIGWQLYQAYAADHGRPDLIHVHASLLAGVAALEIGRRTGVPFVLSEHSTAYARGLVSKAGLRLARAVAGKAEMRFAVSTPFARLLEDRLSMPLQSWSVMPNMVDQSFLDAPLSTGRAGRYRFLHVSLLDEKKCADLIVKAFAQSFAPEDDVDLVIGGDGPTRWALEALTHRLGIAGRIQFPGQLSRDQVRQEMAEADAVVLSSRYETFGVVLIEAMAMGLPVIATRCGGPEDIVTDETGMLVAVDDIAEFGAAMQTTCRSRGKRDRQHLRALCARRFGAAAITRRWHQHYQALTLTENSD